jgi:asparagine synthase (glutamine-hydrolysing)
MCGFAGFIGPKSLDESKLEAFHEALAHRGPDGYGVWTDSSKRVSLVHRRLSIVDLSSAGSQPMQDASGTYSIVFNGEIYNHACVRKELESLGYRFRSSSDTEVILNAFIEWGIACLDRLDGMFAFALYDGRAQELYLVRDRMGIKPLYFSMQGAQCSFASEIKALWQLPWMRKELHYQALYNYLTFLATPAPCTLYKGIYKLPAGFYAKVDVQGSIEFHEWYNPLWAAQTPQPALSEDQCIEQLRVLLRDSVKKRMMADVPVGVFLSGGVDSSLNVALMSECSSNIKSFNVVFEDQPENDERVWARSVAKTFGTKHHEIVINEKDAALALDSIVYHQDEPLADWVCIPLYFVSKLARANGISVVQCGEGADELFCGYSAYAHYIDMYKKYWQPSQRYIPGPARKGLYRGAKLLGKNFQHQDHVYNWAYDRELFWGGAIGFKESTKRDLCAVPIFERDEIVAKIYAGLNQNSYDSYDYVAYHAAKVTGGDILKKMTYLELKHRLPELLLMRLDKMTMAHSVEGREPFLDYKLVEFALSLPLEMKYRGGMTKYILKKACEGILPHEIIYRKKMGFSAPVARWFRTSEFFRNRLQSSLSTIPGINQIAVKNLLEQHYTKDVSPQLWVLTNLALSLKS